MTTSRLIFALLCILGIIAILCGAGLELSRYRRGAGLVSPRLFRTRMASTLLWLIIIGANLYAVTALWPEGPRAGVPTAEAKAQARLFLLVIGGAFSLVFVGIGLFAYDLLQIRRERQVHQLKFLADMAVMAQNETRDHQTKQAQRLLEAQDVPQPENGSESQDPLSQRGISPTSALPPNSIERSDAQ